VTGVAVLKQVYVGSDLHIYPSDDAVEHELNRRKCVCGPEWASYFNSDRFTVMWKYTHIPLNKMEAKQSG
jgi:hypothetical protein